MLINDVQSSFNDYTFLQNSQKFLCLTSIHSPSKTISFPIKSCSSEKIMIVISLIYSTQTEQYLQKGLHPVFIG